MTDIIEILEYERAKTEKEFDIVIEALSFHIFDNDDYYTESSNNSNFFKKICDTIHKIVEKLKTTINKLFKKETVDKKIKEVEKAIEENPSLGNIKVEHTDYDKLDKLATEVRNEINRAKTESEVEEIAKKYRKQRANILKCSAIVVGTIASVFTFITVGHVKKIKTLEEDAKSFNTRVKFWSKEASENREKNKNLNEENDKLKKQLGISSTKDDKKPSISVKIGGKNIGNEIRTAEAKARISAEVMRDTSTDTLNCIKDGLKAFNLFNGMSLGDRVNSLKDAIKTGSAVQREKTEWKNKSSAILDRKLQEKQNEIDKANRIINAGKKKLEGTTDSSKKRQLKLGISVWEKRLTKLKDEYDVLYKNAADSYQKDDDTKKNK